MTKEQQTAVLAAVDKLKTGSYKATAIKVELEAHLSRYSWEISDCHEFLMEHLEDLGLSDGIEARGPLKYARTYNDGSVDTEFTFTLSLKDSKDIFLLPKIIEIWNDMCDEAKNDKVVVSGAGMHMALLDDRNCVYPSRISPSQMRRYHNFRRSMMLALPSLYFLASHNDKSRYLEWRKPSIECADVAHGSGKAWAINYRGGGLEWRLFDTCYHRPEAILDNVVVMSNAMQFWTNTYTDSGLDKICKSVIFGKGGSTKLSRFYCTAEQYDLLEAGLRLLKPSYYTIDELKAERKFTLKRPSEVDRSGYVEELKLQYEEYLERYSEIVRRYGSAYTNKQMSLERFIHQRMREINQDIGQYQITI